MNFAQEIFTICSIGAIAIAAVILNQVYITSDAKYNADNFIDLTLKEFVFVLSVYVSRIAAATIALIFIWAGVVNLFSMFWKWLGTL